MKYSRKAVCTRVINQLQAAHTNVHCGMKMEYIPKSFPFVYIHEISHRELSENTTLAYDDSQWESTFEVQVFTIGDSSMEDAYNILGTIKSIFKNIYYIQESENEVENADHSVYRLVARFRKINGGNDEMPL